MKRDQMKKFRSTVDPDAIRAGRNTDVYFLRTKTILEKKRIDKKVAAEVRSQFLPTDWDWSVFTGIEEVISLLEGIPVNLYGLNEGTIFQAGVPVLVLEGRYLDFCIHETSLLGMICQATGIATKASRLRRVAGTKTLVSFGARKMHPSITLLIDRNAYIGGFDGVSSVISAESLGIDPVGTMPHALVLLIGDTLKAAQHFHEVMPKSVGRVVLVDTFGDEKFESLRVAETLGKRLLAVRLDTPKSRRGSFLEICKEVRWELDLRGFQDVKIFATGGIDEKHIQELVEVADAFGVGSSLSNAPSVDFSFDLVEIEGKPVSKKGKWSGRKKVYRCNRCFKTVVVPSGNKTPRCPGCKGKTIPLLVQHLKNGKRVSKPKSPNQVRNFVLDQLRKLPDRHGKEEETI